MHNREKDLVGDHIEEGENRLYGKQRIRTLEKEHRTIRKDKG